MKVNSGSIDRGIRILAGLALLAWAILFNGPALAYIGIVPLATGLSGWCPAYTIFGINSCKK
jgi:hypothetical protein